MDAKNKNAERKPFNFGDSPLVKTTEQTVVENYQAIEERDLAQQAEKATKAINIELPLALHTRMKIECARQDKKIKEVVPEIIQSWVELQERG